MANGAGRGKVAVITGASSGIGKAAAKSLVARGWRVMAVGRDPERCAAAEREIALAAEDGGAVAMLRADLASLPQAARLAEEIVEQVDRIDVLFNNAGGVAGDFRLTAEGHEETLAGNHIGPFLLTKKLLPKLRSTAVDAERGGVRIVNVSSSAHRRLPAMNWDDPNLANAFNSGVAYCQAKLANLLFTFELARRERANGIVVHAMHPGVVASNFGAASAEMAAYMKSQVDRASSPEHAAETLVWLATADEAGRPATGYWFDRQLEEPAPAALDPAEAERLWTWSEIAARGF